MARSWLVARREKLAFPTVLATVALDRLTDGIVFACLVPVAVLLVLIPDPGGVYAGLIWGGAGSLVLFVALLAGLAIYRRQAANPAARLMRLVDRKLRRRQLTEDGNVEITGRDLREKAPPADQGSFFGATAA